MSTTFSTANQMAGGFRIGAAAIALVLSACGGGGGGGGSSGGSGGPSLPGNAGLSPSSQFAQQCSPSNTLAPAETRTGSLATEKQWLRSYFDEAYLWYDEVPFVDPGASIYSGSDAYTAMDNYFQALKTKRLSPSGALKDKFSFTYRTAAWDALANTGVAAGYGFEIVFGSLTPPSRNIRIAYVEPGSEAATKGLKRGDKLVTVDGIAADDSTAGGVAVLNAAIFPSALGQSHAWVFSRTGSADLSVTLTTASVTKKPVLTRSVVTATDGKKVGYLLFNDHLATAESQLVEAVNFFKAQAIDDLVLDIRYNGGGYLYIASELAYMIAGPARTQSKVFEQLVFSDKRGADTNSPDSTTPFYNADTTSSFLPSLSLPRVYVLAQGSTCSASESIINSLRGVDVDVRLIGGTTCGKPYGFTAKDNCGITYFPIEFKGANDKGFGDYSDGFAPAASGAAGVPGCLASDDLGKELGDPAEGMLASALGYRTSGVCAPVLGMARPQSADRSGASPIAEFMLRGPARENRILRPQH